MLRRLVRYATTFPDFRKRGRSGSSRGFFPDTRQVVSVIRNSIFNTPDDVVMTLERLCRRRVPGSTELGSEIVDKTYASSTRLGEVACWKAWSDRAQVEFTGHALKGIQ